MKIIIQTLLLGSIGLLTGCASNATLESNSQQVEQGVVLEVQAIGSGTNRSTNITHTLGNVGGATVAGMSSNTAQSPLSEQSSLQYIVKLNDTGKIISIVQSVREPLQPGNHVLVVYRDGNAKRISLDKNYLTH
jgi:outer membrane lipoprotein SlyB